MKLLPEEPIGIHEFDLIEYAQLRLGFPKRISAFNGCLLNGTEVFAQWDKHSDLPYQPYKDLPDGITLERYTTDAKLARSKLLPYLASDTEDGIRRYGIPSYFFRLNFINFQDVPMTYLRWVFMTALTTSKSTSSLSLMKLSKQEWCNGPFKRDWNSIRNVSPFINLENLVPSAFIMATDLTIQKTARHNHIGMIAINPSAIVAEHVLNNGLAIVTDLGDGVIGELRDADTIGSLSELIPASTLEFLGF